MLQRCCKLSSRSVYPGFSASSPGQAATPRNPLHSLRFLPSSRETATQAQTGDAYVTSEVLYQLSYVGDSRPQFSGTFPKCIPVWRLQNRR